VTFAEVVAATQARLGQRVKVTIREQGRTKRTCHGVLAPGLCGATEAVPDEDGKVAFRVAPNAWWFLLRPDLVTDAQEQPGGRVLRVEMVGESAFVIETLGEP
jgi:hypothetical protein